MSRLFNPVDLLNQQVEANATRRDPLPIGEVVAQIIEMDFKEGISNKPGKPPVAWNRLNCKLEITDPEYLVKISNNPPKAIITLGTMLDMENGQIKTGANVNVRLGRLREATGTNGKPLSAMNGCWLRLSIGHKQHPTDPELGDVEEILAYTKV